jgi:hypothetical protein
MTSIHRAGAVAALLFTAVAQAVPAAGPEVQSAALPEGASANWHATVQADIAASEY